MLCTKMPDWRCLDFVVVACFVEYDGKILMLQRHPDKPSGNLWGLPAGKVDDGESLTAALCRELREETGLAVNEENLLPQGSVLVQHGDVYFEYSMFKVVLSQLPTIVINPIEHVSMGWFTPQFSLTLPQVEDQAACTLMVYPR